MYINLIKNKKSTNILIACIALIIIVALIGLMTNFNKDSKYYAKEFLEIVTNPEDLESTRYFRDVFDSEGTGQYSIEEYGESMEKDYGDLMTDRGFDSAVSNRFIPWDVLIREDVNYKVEVDSVDIIKMGGYEDGRVHYGYSISLRVSFSDGENEAMTVSGDIVMAEENSQWLVDAFRGSSDYQDLYKLLLPF